MDSIKKFFKVIAIITAVAAAVAGIVLAIKKITEKKNADVDSEENYVSCSCCEVPENN